MKALSIRQPWAWLILHGGKDIENRRWHTPFRGRFYIHAAKGMTRREYEDAQAFITGSGIQLPEFSALERGGIVGEAEMVRCVTNHPSPWFVGPFGFVIANAKPLPFKQCSGSLGFFEVQIFNAPQA